MTSGSRELAKVRVDHESSGKGGRGESRRSARGEFRRVVEGG